MEQFNKEDLLQLQDLISPEHKSGGSSSVDVESWPEELQTIYQALLLDGVDANELAVQIIEQQEADVVIRDAMLEVELPDGLMHRIRQALEEQFSSRSESQDVGPEELVRPRMGEVVQPRMETNSRRRSLQLVGLMSVVVFGLALWPLLVPNRPADLDFTQIEKTITPWFSEIEKIDTWQSDVLATETANILRLLQQNMNLGIRSKYGQLSDGREVFDFSSPRNGKVVVFILASDAPQVANPSFEVLQVSGSYGAAIGRIGSLRILLVTDESMKRVQRFFV